MERKGALLPPRGPGSGLVEGARGSRAVRANPASSSAMYGSHAYPPIGTIGETLLNPAYGSLKRHLIGRFYIFKTPSDPSSYNRFHQGASTSRLP